MILFKKNNKKATVILILAVLGLIIGVVTFLGMSALKKPSDLPQYIGEQQLAMLRTDVLLADEQLFVREAAPYAASSAIFSMAQHGGFYEKPACGDTNGAPIWMRENATKFCLPVPTQAFETYLNDALNVYLKPINRGGNSTFAIETTPTPTGMQITGKARTLWKESVTIKEKRAPIGELGANASFATEVATDFGDYTLLGTEVKTMAKGIVSCQQSTGKSANACVEEWLDVVNTGPFLTNKRITVHYDDCSLSSDDSLEKLRSHTGMVYVFCASKDDGRTFIAHDPSRGSIELRSLEYRFSIEFG
ncbi:MAG: hypothetical protein Q7R76_02005 [Candidatus Woesearchaeota archaeon]|nr:hypothetical protein [Candidatus Woesearchaeota archaeon]